MLGQKFVAIEMLLGFVDSRVRVGYEKETWASGSKEPWDATGTSSSEQGKSNDPGGNCI